MGLKRGVSACLAFLGPPKSGFGSGSPLGLLLFYALFLGFAGGFIAKLGVLASGVLFSERSGAGSGGVLDSSQGRSKPRASLGPKTHCKITISPGIPPKTKILRVDFANFNESMLGFLIIRIRGQPFRAFAFVPLS